MAPKEVLDRRASSCPGEILFPVLYRNYKITILLKKQIFCVSLCDIEALQIVCNFFLDQRVRRVRNKVNINNVR